MQRSNRFFFGVAFASVVFVGGMAALLIDVFLNVPDFTELRTGQVKMAIYNPKKEKSFRMVGPKAPGWVPVTSVSQNLLMAVVASEDTSFFSHEGIDYHELREAIKKDLKERRFARGASTITQQVVKNVYLDRSKTIWRKVREFLWAREMDKVLSKSEILGVYVNAVEWGPNIYGIRQASSHYFGTAPSALTAKQGAFLALLLPSPVKYHNYYVTKEITPFAARRMRQILRVMYRMKFVDADSYEVALREPLWDSATEPPLADDELRPKDGEGDFSFPEVDDPDMRPGSSAPDIVREGETPKGSSSSSNAAPDEAPIAPAEEPEVPEEMKIDGDFPSEQ